MEIIDFVNEKDEVVGKGTQAEAHATNIPHRSSSILIFNSAGKLLLTVAASHKRHAGKYFHSAGGHVRSGESYETAAARELKEELGIEVPLEIVTKFNVAHSHVTLFKGYYDGDVVLNEESESYDWLSKQEVDQLLKTNPEKFTQYFLRGLEHVGWV